MGSILKIYSNDDNATSFDVYDTFNGVTTKIATVPAAPAVQLISFSLNTNQPNKEDLMDPNPVVLQYQCEDGMTWAEFCSSEYNYSNGYVMLSVDGDIVETGTNNDLALNYVIVSASDVIVADAQYALIGGGSGN